MEILAAEAAKLGICLSAGQIEKFARYEVLLSDWNKKFNLTAMAGGEIIYKHFADSLSAVKHIGAGAQRVIDIGSGAGFPGIPVSIARPDIKMTLLDATGKKIAFLEEAIRSLGLENVNCVQARAEAAGRGHDFRENFDAAVGRAVAPLYILAEYALPFVKTGGKLVALKGPGAEKEITEAEKIIKILGGEIYGIFPAFFTVRSKDGTTETVRHRIVVINKTGRTPEKYPRENNAIKRGRNAKNNASKGGLNNE